MNRSCPHCQAPIHPNQGLCAVCERVIAAADDAVTRNSAPARPSSKPDATSDSSTEISIVPNYSRHQPRKVRIPPGVRDLNLKLKNVSTQKRNASDSRFKTDAKTAQTTESNQQFLAQYREAYDLTEAQEYDRALKTLTQMIETATPEQQAECHGLRGYVFLQRSEFEKSIAECSRAIALNPSDPQAFSWRAAARGELNQWRLAFEDLHSAVDRSDDRSEEFEQLLTSYAKVATEHFRQLISQGNATATVLFERGWMYHRLDNSSKALRDFQQALKLNPTHPWASAGLAKLAFAATPPITGVSPKLLDQLCRQAMEGDNECQRVALAVRAKLFHQQLRGSDVAKCVAMLHKLAGEHPTLLIDVARLQYELDDAIAAAETLTQLLDTNPQYHEAWLLRAKCAFAMRNDALAVDDYSEFLLRHPENASALVQRAEAEARRGNLDLAMDDVDRALEIDDLSFDAWLMRGKIASMSGQLAEATTSCDHAKALNNQAAEVYALLGSVFHQMGDFSRAAEEYSRSVDYAKTDSEKACYLYHRGIEWYQLAEYSEAYQDFTESLSLRPDHAGTLIWRAATLSRTDEPGAAIEDLHQAIAIRPSSADSYRQLGRATADTAVGHFTRRHQRGHDGPDLFRQRGRAYHFLSQYAEAIDDYSTALNLDPKDIVTRIARGQALRQQGNFTAAYDDYTNVIKLDPQSHAAYYGRANALLEKGNVDAARFDIGQAIKLSTPRSRYHALAAMIAHRSDDPDAQRTALDHAIAYDPTDPSHYLDRAILDESTGRLENAMRDLTQALEIEPSQVSVLQRRAQLALKMNQPAQATEDFGKALTMNPIAIRSWTGLAKALANQNQHQDGLICLTKAMHRFPKPQNLAQIVLARGKLFQRAGRLAPAVTDFSSVVELLVEHPKQQANAILARAIAYAQLDEFEPALEDFTTLQQQNREDTAEVSAAIAWLNDRSKPRPEALCPPKKMIRPTRPPMIRDANLNWLPDQSWDQLPPHDQWVVHLGPQKEFGPVRYDIMLMWIREGRLDSQTRLLRSDWDRWRKLGNVFSNIDKRSESAFPTMKEIPYE